jgi:hypothetical protein
MSPRPQFQPGQAAALSPNLKTRWTVLINTPIHEGELNAEAVATVSTVLGRRAAPERKTVQTVNSRHAFQDTPLKRGVNEKSTKRKPTQVGRSGNFHF